LTIFHLSLLSLTFDWRASLRGQSIDHVIRWRMGRKLFPQVSEVNQS
jgi:hypothetical protein